MKTTAVAWWLAAMLPMLATAETVVVASAKRAGTLTADQVSGAYLGKHIAFADGATIVPINQNPGPVRDAFLLKITGKEDAQLKAYWAKLSFTGKGEAPKEVAGDADVKKAVASNPNAIGYIDKGSVDGTVAVVFTP